MPIQIKLFVKYLELGVLGFSFAIISWEKIKSQDERCT
jgi:hypothetical protein